jgi:hypothetical protein
MPRRAEPRLQDNNLTPHEGQPCEECGYVPADPYSGLCERCLFGAQSDEERQRVREAFDG